MSYGMMAPGGNAWAGHEHGYRGASTGTALLLRRRETAVGGHPLAALAHLGCSVRCGSKCTHGHSK